VCQQLPGHGWDCTVVLPPVEHEFEGDWKNWPCDLHTIGDTHSWAKLMRAAANRILACEPDVVVGVGAWHMLPNVMRFLYRRGLSSVPYLDALVSDQPSEYRRLRDNSDVTARVAAVSESCRKGVTQLVPDLADRVDRYWSAVPPGPRPCPNSSAQGPLRIVYVGHVIQRWKRILDLPEIVAGMLSRGVDFKLEIVGDGGERPELERRVFSLPGAAARVTMRGWLSNDSALQLLARQHAMLLMSEVEGQPVALLECMAQGVAPVVTTLPGHEELVRNDENGVLVSVGDTVGFVKAFEALAGDRDRLHRLRTAAWESVQKHAVMPNAVRAFADVLSRTAAGGMPDLSSVLPPCSPHGRMAAWHVPEFVQEFKRWMLREKVR
jgi:glycosyltransferase involved in cell wall biosynthesis